MISNLDRSENTKWCTIPLKCIDANIRRVGLLPDPFMIGSSFLVSFLEIPLHP